jgi:hypothetical protein
VLRRRGHQKPLVPEKNEHQALAYELVMLRIMDQEAKSWQAASLAMAAMAFLLTVALGSESSQASRVLSAGLSAMIAIITVQLVTKHRVLGRADVKEARRLERELGLPSLSTRRKGDPDVTRARWPVSISSYRIWLCALSVFALVSAGIAVAATVRPALFD